MSELCVRCSLPREKHVQPERCNDCGEHHPAYACIPPEERACARFMTCEEEQHEKKMAEQRRAIEANDRIEQGIKDIADSRDRWMATALDLRVKLAESIGKQAACIGHTADIVVCRLALKQANRALAHYRDDEDPALTSIRNALARVSTRPELPKGIYFASKVEHAARWRELRARGVPIVSTWIDEAGPGDSGGRYADLWIRCINEASCAGCLIAYAEPGEVMKGALAEIGAALAHGVPVIYVGPAMDKGVIKHPLVTLAPDIESAIRTARGSQ